MDSEAVPYVRWVPRMRSDAEIEHMLRWLPGVKSLSATFQRGARDTLLWVLGRAEVSPITGKVLPQPIARAAVSTEAYEATTAMYNGGRPPTPDGRTLRLEPLPAGYLQGVEHLAMWVTGSDTMGHPEDWPFPAEAPALAEGDPRRR